MSFKIKVGVASVATRPCLIRTPLLSDLDHGSSLPGLLALPEDFMCTPTAGPLSPLFPLPWMPLLPHPDVHMAHLDFCVSLYLIGMPFLAHLCPLSVSYSALFSPEYLQSSHIPAISSFIILLSVFPTGL